LINLSSSDCQKPVFTHYLVDPNSISKVGQVGTVHGSGQFTVGRSYVSVKNNVSKVPLYAPTDMVLTRGSYYQVPAPNSENLGIPRPDYALYFDAGCKVEIHLGHVKEVVPAIARQFSSPKSDSRTIQLERVSFKAGDLVGYFINNAGVAAFDFMVHDESRVVQFANQARHEYGQNDKLFHKVCPYDFYSGQMKNSYYQLIGGNESTTKECGPISRDFNGTISGLWFLDKEVKKSIYDYTQEGTYGSVLPIVGDSDRVIIGRLSNRPTTTIYPSYPTYKDPRQITAEHCYQIHSNGNPQNFDGYVFFKLSDEKTLNVFYNEHGECPLSFPSGGATYYR
jgi:hypothetical protein